MVQPCEPHTFTNPKYFLQHEMKQGSTEYDFTRCFAIWVTGTGEGKETAEQLSSLQIYIQPVLEDDDRGVKKKDGSTWDVQLKKLFGYERSALMPPDNPLDFYLKRRSCVIIRLMDTFWRFSSLLDPITTKQDLGQHYHNLQRHVLRQDGSVDEPNAGEPYHCISFFTDQPCDQKAEEKDNVRHGFSLNVELVMGDGKFVLPITLDPDIENKGGHG